MKNVVVIFAHPDLDNNSVANSTILSRVKELENVEIRELYKLYPDFKIDVEAEQDALLRADKIVLQFPLFWYSSPAILKEWEDKVLTYGFAYGTGGDKLNGKEIVVSTTIGGSKEAYSPEGENSFSIEQILVPFEQSSNFTGMIYSGEPIVSYGMYIDGVTNSQDSVVDRAEKHAQKLIEWISN
jgi:putative NADPH-quinone reductase